MVSWGPWKVSGQRVANALVAKVVIQIAVTHHCRRQLLGFIVEKGLKIVADSIRRPPATGGTGSTPVLRK